MRLYVTLNDIDGRNDHYRKALRSTLKLHPEVQKCFKLNEINLITAMILAWLPHKKQFEWLQFAMSHTADELVEAIKNEESS